MKNVTKIAKKSAGLSQKCSVCPIMKGAAIIKAINKGYSQPELKSYIEKFYCEKVCLHLLNDSLLKLNYYS